MILIPVDRAKPTRGDYAMAGAQAYRVVWDHELMLLCWLTLELATGRGWRKSPQIAVMDQMAGVAA